MTEQVAPFDRADIAPLEPRHRDVMLDLILMWGALDTNLGILLASLRGMPLDQGAAEIAGAPTWRKFAEIIKVAKSHDNGRPIADFFRRHKDEYERRSKPRNSIAHATCAGIWTRDPDYIVFLPFEAHAPGEMAVDLVPLDEMERAIRWGQAMYAVVRRIAFPNAAHP